MKTLEIEDLKKMDLGKLNEELFIAKKELFKTKFEVKSGHSKSSHLIAVYKKYVAQIKTILKERNLKA